jgi:hypothetical protein
MFYFNSFPKITTTDYKGNGVVATNIMTRVNMISSLMENPLLFYSYDIQEGDTPEIVASKYYGDANRHWMVLYANQILDPQWSWPLTTQQLGKYIEDKYLAEADEAGVPSSISYAQQTIKHHLKTFGTNNSDSVRTNLTVIVGEEDWNLIQPGTITQTFANGTSVQKIISKSAISLYDYEVQANERKRKIFLINNIYASQLESQFKELMSR